jgi:tetraacyldisaccharide 4'-kinase
MRSPNFWYPQKDPSTASLWTAIATRLLMPLASVYDLVGQARQKYIAVQKAEAPVICVGNLTAGGTGKTPIAITLGQALKERGQLPFFLTRGYGGHEDGPLLVNEDQHNCRDVGDEALMLAAHAPTIVSRNRVDGAALACRLGANIIVMDDGYQNPNLKKDFSILVVDGELAFGNGHVIPAGPLREQAATGLERADQIIVARKEGAVSQSFSNNLFGDLPVINIRLGCPANNQGDNRHAIAFAGIEQPEKFFAAVRDQNYQIVGTQTYADHHNYSEDEFNALVRWSEQRKAVLVTTEKDTYRLTPAQRLRIEVLPLQVYFDSPRDLDNLIAKVLAMSPASNQHQTVK